MEKKTLLQDLPHLKNHIQETLHRQNTGDAVFPKGVTRSNEASAVLFLISGKCPGDASNPNPCLVLNKRSRFVKQPGDLCFPGGAIAHFLDPKLAQLMKLPVFPLWRWSYWRKWQKERSGQARRLALLFATGVRESFEEMMLNPFGIQFLGPLPPHRLIMFKREIYPFAGWIESQKRFFVNREVEKIVHIPLRELLKEDNYARYNLLFNVSRGPVENGAYQEFPCFQHHSPSGTDILWGATYRIVMTFMDLIFGFEAPEMERLEVVEGVIDEGYYRNHS